MLRLLLILLAFSFAAFAGSIEQTFNFDWADTGWSSNVVINKYDGALPLTSVVFAMTGGAQGTIRLENTSESEAGTANSRLKSSVTLFEPLGGIAILITLPTATFSDSLTIYDGINDWGGGSGATHNASATHDANATYDSTTPGKLGMFIGSGTLALPISTSGDSGADGTGNFLFAADTETSAFGTITYNFDDQVPEPAMLTLVGGGLLSLGFFARRRKKA